MTAARADARRAEHPAPRALRVRRTVRRGPDPSPTFTTVAWDPARAALIICDMWDRHHCASAEARVAEMAPRVDRVARELRAQGATIVHAPSGCVDFYAGTAQRRRAASALPSGQSVERGWRAWDPAVEEPLPPSFLEPGPCSCDSTEPCCTSGPPYPWTRQIASIDICEPDAVSEDAREIFGLLDERRVDHVVVVGVHTNLCVLGRPFGIRQLVHAGKRPILCRDLTDSFHRDAMGHCAGTELVVRHVERFWCPTVTSDQLVGGAPFRFAQCVGRPAAGGRAAGA